MTPTDLAGTTRSGPLTACQRELYALDALAPDPRTLNLAYALHIEGPLDIAAFREALRDVVRAHEPLRTRYGVHNGAVTATVADPELAAAVFALPRIQVHGMAEAADYARRDRDRAFDLASEPPLRAALLDSGDGRHVLLLCLHHIAADGWSIDLLVRQISRAYTMRHTSGVPPLGPKYECLDQAAEQQQWLASPQAAAEGEWWAQHVAEADPRPLSEHGPAAPERGEGLTRYSVSVPDGVTASLRSLSREATVSLYSVMTAAYAGLLHLWTGTQRPLIGTLVAGRTTARAGEILGAHYNPVPLAADLSGDPSLAECVLRAGAVTVSVLDHQTLPYPVLARRLERAGVWDARRMPQTAFIMDRYPPENLRLNGCDTTGLYLDGPTEDTATSLEGGGTFARVPCATSADLTFAVRDAGGHLTISAFHRPAVVDGAFVLGALERYLDLLAGLGDAPYTPLGAFEPVMPVSSTFDSPVAGSGSTGPSLRLVGMHSPFEAISPVGHWSSPILNQGLGGI